MRRPYWPPHLRAFPSPGEGVFLLAERGSIFLADPALALMAPLLDGTRTDEEVIDALEGQVEGAHVYLRLFELRSRGRVWDALPFSPVRNEPGAAAWLASAGQRRLGGLRVNTDHPQLQERLREMGLRSGTDLQVVFTDDYLRPELFALEGRWLPVKDVGHQLWVGPIVEPEGPCWECLAHRLRLNRRGETYLAARLGDASPYQNSLAWLPSTRALAVELTATEVFNLAMGKGLGAQLLVYDCVTRESRLHRVVKRPQCQRCGQAPDRVPVMLSASPRPAGSSHGGDPDETYARLKHHISPITGLIARVTVPPDQDELVQVVQTWQNLGLRAPGVGWLRNTIRMLGMGKGRTFAQARVSALAEALERHCGVCQGYEVARTASFQALGDEALHPNRLMQFSERQYERRDLTNPHSDPSSYVPPRFDESEPLAWSQVWSLTHGAPRYAPTAQVYFVSDATPDDHGVVACCPDSNGCAAGGTLEEALLQGFYELLERDSIALWYYQRRLRPGIDLEALGLGPVVTHFRTRHQREIWVLDITSDLGVPAYVAVSRRLRPPETILMGFGAHLDPLRAVRGAINELGQLLTFFAANSQSAECMMHNANRWFVEATLENQPYLGPHGAISLPSAAFASPDAREEFSFLQSLLEGHGFEVLALDQTRPDVQLRVGRVIVPGLRHFWPRFAPGRLYQDGLGEEELNPLPIFL